MNSPLLRQFATTTNGFNFEVGSSANRYYHPHHHPTPPEEILDDDNQVPSPMEFGAIIDDYLRNLSPKKRDKALVDQQRYQLIQQVLKDPRNTAISTAQFRFWVKKMFQLQPGTIDLVCHDGKPVAMREQIYTILVKAHREAHHGGRDKTSALVRRKFSWIPKELVARFVRHCPFCITRRNGTQSPPSVYKSTSINQQPSSAYVPSTTAQHHHQHHYDAATSVAAVASSMLCTPLIQEDSDIASSGPPSTEHGYDTSPNYNTAFPTRRSTNFIYNRDEEEELLKSYHNHYESPPKGLHDLPFNIMSSSKAATTMLMAPTTTSSTTSDHPPNDNSDRFTTTPSSTSEAAAAAAAAAALFYQQPCMGYSSYYYPNILGIAPCDNTASTTAATTNSIAVAEILREDATNILAHHHQQQQEENSTTATTQTPNNATTFPFSITTVPPPDHFISSSTSISNDDNDTRTIHSLLPSYDRSSGAPLPFL